jgi:formylglycine-generating enzyme required for sulfatase activity
MGRRIPNKSCASLAAVSIVFLVAQSAAVCASAAVTFSWAVVGNPGNPTDPIHNYDGTSGYGSVSYTYQISTTDVTAAQYIQFLNAADPSGVNPNGIYSGATDAEYGVAFNSAGASGAKYSVVAGHANQPIVDVTWNDAARFVNWLSNGQGSGGTETGVYDMSQPLPPRNPNATIFLPTENEWYKAAYYDATSGSGKYWEYATRSNLDPPNSPPPGLSNWANYYNGGYTLAGPDHLTDVGAYNKAKSYYGTFDQTGDVYEWTDTAWDVTLYGYFRVIRGGSWDSTLSDIGRGYHVNEGTASDSFDLGFRVAGSVPEPTASFFLPTLTLATLRRGRRARAA